MMCADMEAKLNEYVDSTLAPAARTSVEEHLVRCAGCRAAVADLRGLVAGARELPPSIEPSRDLWTGIAGRIGRRESGSRRWWRERTFWGGALAAAATLVIAFGVYHLTARPPDRRAGEWGAVAVGYEQAARELSRTLAAERDRLRPETVAVIERNLRIIDAAIAESRAALARDPGNAELRQLFAAAYRQKVELLRWAARAATAT